MKMTKDQKQKIVLGGMIVVGVIYAYFEFLLGPLRAGRQAAIQNAAALDPKIAAAQAQIAKVAALKQKEPQARLLMQQVDSMIPSGSPIAWFPPRIVDFFKKYGIDKITARLNSEPADKELTGFKCLNWGIEAPNVQFMQFAAAVSALENGEPLIQVQAFEVETSREEIGKERASLTLNNIIRQ
jgi:hypothetical protein